MIICPNCGTEISESAKFCRKCGTRIEAADRLAARDEETVVLDGPEKGPEADRMTGRTESDLSEERTVFADAAPEDTAYTDRTESPDTGVEFDWNQPVEIERPEIHRRTEAPAADAGGMSSGAEQAAASADGGPYDWAAPTGEPDPASASMPPVYVGGPEEEQRTYGYYAQAPEWDHTAEFDPKDISDNKVTAMAAYLLGPLGVIIALLSGQNSPYAAFHMQQGLKFLILEALTALVMTLLCWTIIVPVAGCVFLVILMILEIVSFVSVCKGRAVEPPIIRGMRFMK